VNTDLQLEIPGSRIRPLDLGNFVLRRGLWILVCGGLLFALGSPLAFLLSKPYYRASGRLLLTQKVKMFLDRQEQIIQGDFRDFAATYAERLSGSAVARRALEATPRAQWPEFLRGIPDPGVAANVLAARLAVIPIGRSHLMEVALTSGEAAGMAETLNAVMQSFVDLLHEEQAQDSDRRLAYLEQELRELSTSLAQVETSRRSVEQELGHSSFSEERNPFYELLIAVQSEHQRALAGYFDQETKAGQTAKEQEVLGARDLGIFAEEAVFYNESVYLIDNWTYQKLQDLRTGIDGLTEDNPDRIYVEERMRAMNDYLEEFKKELHTTALGLLERKRAFELSEAVAKAQAALDAREEFEEKLKGQLDEARQQFARSSALVNQGKELSEEMSRLKERIGRVQDRIREVQLEAKLPVHVGIDELAVAPAAPEGDNLGKLLAMIFVGAFGCVGVSLLAYEFLDGRIRGAADIRAALGALPADPVPAGPPERMQAAVRGLALRLESERKRSGAKIALLCGAERGAGSSWIAVRLAEAMTQYADRILVVRLDEPETSERIPASGLGYDFESFFEDGRRQLLRIPDRVTLLPLGDESPLLSRRDWLRTFLERLTADYDIILLDTRPLPGSDLSRFVAGFSHIGILVARQRHSHFGAFRKAVELAVRLRVPALTGVLVGKTEQPLERLLALAPQVVERLVPETAARIRELILARSGAWCSRGLAWLDRWQAFGKGGKA